MDESHSFEPASAASADTFPHLPEADGMFSDDVPSDDGAASRRPSLGPLLDVPVTVEAVLGGTSMAVEDLLRLGAGSVIEIDRRVGDPVDLVVSGRVIARGELVLIDGALGMTLTEIVRREEK